MLFVCYLRAKDLIWEIPGTSEVQALQCDCVEVRRDFFFFFLTSELLSHVSVLAANNFDAFFFALDKKASIYSMVYPIISN